VNLLEACDFPAPGTSVDLAVSGGPDSLGLLLLALEASLSVVVHHVDHHVRAGSGEDARYVQEIATALAVPCITHDVTLIDGEGNFEARARSLRRSVLPPGTLTGHTMDDLAETVLLNMMRGAGVDGLSPMIDDATKPLRRVRRGDLHWYVAQSGFVPRYDETNDLVDFRRNRVRHELLPVMNDVAARDVVPLLERQARVLYDDRAWLDELARADEDLTLEIADCRKLVTWPAARLTRWLRTQLSTRTAEGETYPPSFDEVARALAVVRGEATACELSGGRRLSRSAQRLTLV
jgi:tRNA(Ile)-lysidine synthase